MNLDIDDLIIRPGHFVLAPDKRYRVTEASREEKLDRIKDPNQAADIYKAYVRCHNNAVDLMIDAEVLFQAGRYARSFALAIIAWEELGKSQIAADYYSGILTHAAYKAAYKDHKVKTAYLNRAGAIDGETALTVAYNPTIGHRLEEARQTALYASANNMPNEEITKENAKDAMKRVNEHIEYINFAENFNGRIGSKALFK
jgi:AbiV family abortive infection protein